MENYKQKYEHLAKSIKDLYPYMLADCREKAERMILELEMSEDEKIRKGLINFLKSPFVSENITDEKVTPWIDWLEKQGKETQDPCEKCNHPMLNCCNFPCIQKKAFDQGKTMLDVMNEEKADNQNCVKILWGEDDEKMWAQVINEIEAIKSNSSTVFEKNIAQDKIDWLKSLKERVQPQNFTVTDEELAQAKKNAYNDVLDKIEYHSDEPTFDDGWSAAIDFFQKKSLRPQPKQEFSEGDWITIDNPCQIISIEGNYIVQYCDDEKTREISKKFCESQFHLWTIQDAKDGDILASENGCPFIYKNTDGIEAHFYCCVSITNNFCTADDAIHCGYKESSKPATKEQRDRLFQKMQEAGYEWDAGKKELKRIEKKLTYKDVARELFKDNFIHTIDDLGGYAEFYNDGDEGCHYRCNATSKRQFEKLRAINMLMNVAKYLNDGWQPDWCDVVKHKYYISMLDGEITVGYLTSTPCLDVYFKSEELAKKAIEILGEDTIRLALCTDY